MLAYDLRLNLFHEINNMMYLRKNRNRRIIIIATLLVAMFIWYSYFDSSPVTSDIFKATEVIMEPLVSSIQHGKAPNTVQSGFPGTSSTSNSTAVNFRKSNDVVIRYVSKFLERKFKPSDTIACDITHDVIEIHHPSHVSTEAIESCISNYHLDFKKGLGFHGVGIGKIRWIHHRYLTNTSVVLDIGGNTGIDAENIISWWNPKLYIIFEPVKFYYEHLMKQFSGEKGVLVLPFGAGANNAIHKVSIAGYNGDATSIFAKQNSNKTTTVDIQTFNITEIFMALQLNCLSEFDLVTINCEGCEYEVLEELAKTNVLKFIKNIQFAAHTKLPYLKDPISRYCRIQELLSATHTLTYQYKFVWESWRKKDLFV